MKKRRFSVEQIVGVLKQAELGVPVAMHLAAHAGLGGGAQDQPGAHPAWAPMQNGHVESFHGCLCDECLNASGFRTLNDVRRTVDNYREEYNCERPHSSLAYRTPAELRRALGCGDVESKERFPHLHSPDYDGEIYSPTPQIEKLRSRLAERNGAGQRQATFSFRRSRMD